MRLGKGYVVVFSFESNILTEGYRFNSYTQEICVDDAVVIKGDREENVLTNDGTTMKSLSTMAHDHEGEYRNPNAVVTGSNEDGAVGGNVKAIEAASGHDGAPDTSQDDSALTDEELAKKKR